MLRTAVLAALALATTAAAKPVEAKAARQGKRTLFVHSEEGAAKTYSKFLAGLKARGHEVTAASSNEAAETVRYGEQMFDNIVLFAPTVDSFAGLDVAALTAFADAGGNLLVAGSPTASTTLRNLAHEFGVDYDAPKARVIDHFSFDKTDAGAHTRVLSSAFFPSSRVVGPAKAPVVYEGTGLSFARDNIFVLAALTASSTGYSALPSEAIKEYPQSVGSDTVLVAAAQARNNARAVFTGSLWMFSDEAAGVAGAGNGDFTQAVAAWAFQEAGVLRSKNLKHARVDGRPAEVHGTHPEQRDVPRSMFPHPEIAEVSYAYRIKDDVRFSVDIEELTPTGWVPYVADDVQLEFVMLDPYVRTALATNGKGTFATEFKVPDVYGVYHFRVQYRRPGLSVLSLRDQVTIRPFRHDEYERFILCAYPYYATAFAMMGGVFVFSILYLHFTGKEAAAATASAKAKTQ